MTRLKTLENKYSPAHYQHCFGSKEMHPLQVSTKRNTAYEPPPPIANRVTQDEAVIIHHLSIWKALGNLGKTPTGIQSLQHRQVLNCYFTISFTVIPSKASDRQHISTDNIMSANYISSKASFSSYISNKPLALLHLISPFISICLFDFLFIESILFS